MSDKTEEFNKYLIYESSSLNDLCLFLVPSSILAKWMTKRVERKMRKMGRFEELRTRIEFNKHHRT